MGKESSLIVIVPGGLNGEGVCVEASSADRGWDEVPPPRLTGLEWREKGPPVVWWGGRWGRNSSCHRTRGDLPPLRNRRPPGFGEGKCGGGRGAFADPFPKGHSLKWAQHSRGGRRKWREGQLRKLEVLT